MIKHIIREVAPESCDFSFYFDGDCFSSRAGDFCYNLFILGDRHHKGLNSKEYEDVQDTMQGVIDGFEEVDTRGYYFQSYKNVGGNYDSNNLWSDNRSKEHERLEAQGKYDC